MVVHIVTCGPRAKDTVYLKKETAERDCARLNQEEEDRYEKLCASSTDNDDIGEMYEYEVIEAQVVED